MSCCNTTPFATDGPKERSGHDGLAKAAQSKADSVAREKSATTGCGCGCGTGNGLEEEVRALSTPLDNGEQQLVVVIPAMHCAGCISKIEKGLHALPQVVSARANLSTRRVTIVWDARFGQGSDLRKTISELGFEHHVLGEADDGESHLEAQGRSLLLCLAVAGFASANIMLLSVSVWSGADPSTTQLFHLLSGLIAVPAVAFAGRPFFASALSALRNGHLNMDVPISLAVLLSLAMGVFESMNGGHEAYFDACVTLLFFLLIGRTLDHHMRLKARGAVASLAKLAAPGALEVMDNGQTRFVASQDIAKGMLLRVQAGERLPVDGVVISGSTDVDRSLVTGESDPVSIAPGCDLEAGILNLTGPIDLQAKGTADTSFLAEIQRMMEAAEQGRGRYRRIADRMASIYAPAVHLLALITFIGWLVVTGGDWKASLYVAIAVLIITCPCALGLAVPVVHVVGASRLFREGILVRDGGALERMAEIDTAVFDKTGTLTKGEPRLDYCEGLQVEDLIPLYGLASRSSHPASKAVLQGLHDRFLDAGVLTRDGSGKSSSDTISSIKEMPGLGMEGIAGGKRVRLGRPSWVAEIASSKGKAPTVHAGANASLMFAREGSNPAVLSTRDTSRPDARASIAHLSGLGIRNQILSGDRRDKVWALGAELDISTVEGDLLPGEKLRHIEKLGEDGHKTLMVGDGLNDAPALTAAHVSMAPASASEVGRMASDFVFLNGSLGAVPVAYEISKHTGRFVRQNFGLALLYNAIAVPLAMTGFVTPLIAAIAMSASSIVVVANSMRLWQVPVFKGSESATEVDMDRTVERGIAPTLDLASGVNVASRGQADQQKVPA
ncbi:MAG: heavy metal translocating P-type ATPase [Pseudomonadota bacterium]